MTFRLLTYNILHGGGDRVAAIAEVIKACAPDLVLLQEATDPAKVEKIAELSGMADYRSVRRQSLAFVSRKKVAFCEWVRPRVSRHAFIDIVPAGERVRVFGVHLSAMHAAWTEQRRVLELRALLRKIARSSRALSRARGRLQHHRAGRDARRPRACRCATGRCCG